MILVFIAAALVIAADQVTKYIMAGLLPGLPGRSMAVIEDVLHFTYVENEGAAFGMLSEHRWIFMILSVIGLCLIVLLVAKEKPKSPWVRLAAGLVLGGGIGNMIDRLGFGFAEKSGAVLDFIDCRFVDFYVFNVADACVTVGCFLYLFLIVVGEIRAAKEKKTVPAEGTDETENGADKETEKPDEEAHVPTDAADAPAGQAESSVISAEPEESAESTEPDGSGEKNDV